MRWELAIWDRVSVHIRDAYHIYWTIEWIIVGTGYREYYICWKWYQDCYHSKIEPCCKQEISDYFIN